MSGPRHRVTPAMKEAMLNTLLEIRNAGLAVPNRAVRDMAEVLECHPRTIRRWLAEGKVAQNDRSHWIPTEDEYKRMLRDFGSVQGYRQALIDQGIEVPSLSTMHRGFREHTAAAERAWARRGMAAARGMMPTTSMPDLLVNDEWAMDDTMCPVWCIRPDGTVGKVWQQTLVDEASRRILAFTLRPEPFTSEDAVETLATAVLGFHTEDDVFVGGRPRAFRTDRGGNFIAEAMSLGLIAALIDRKYSFPYTPEQNGKIERWHRTYKTLFRDVEGFDRTHWKQGNPEKAKQPPPRDQLLLYEELVVEAHKRVGLYNTARVHSAHGRTPDQFWADAVAAMPELIQKADPVSIRAAMRQTDTRLLRRRRLEWGSAFYALHPESVLGDEEVSNDVLERRSQRIAAKEGQEVQIRFLHGRVEYLSVYTLQGEYLGDAIREDLQSPEQAAETLGARRKHIQTINATLDDIAKREAEAIARRREEALAAADPDSGTYGASKPESTAKAKKAKAKSPRMQQQKEAAEAQRREDIASASEWDFSETA